MESALFGQWIGRKGRKPWIGYPPWTKRLSLGRCEATITLGARELYCRLNGNASSFDRTARDLDRAAQIRMSGEWLRQVVEAEGKRVQMMTQEGLLAPGFGRLRSALVTWMGRMESRSRLRGPAKRKAVDQLLRYAAERQEMICYPEFQAKGWQIGSGPTESMCKVVPRRVKGVGMRWDRDHAEAVMALEGMEQGHQWAQYWATSLHTLN